MALLKILKNPIVGTNGEISMPSSSQQQWIQIPNMMEYKVTYNKLWSADAGRTVNGYQKGTLIGIFPKIEVSVGKLIQAYSQEIQNLVLLPRTFVQYYNDTAGVWKMGIFYFGDVASTLKHGENQRRESTAISIISCTPMADHVNVT